jgi:protein gp37
MGNDSTSHYRGVTINGQWTGICQILDNSQAVRQLYRWRKPRRIFVCSMGDLFHEAVSVEQLDRVFGLMASQRKHTFLLLTKRPERMAEYLRGIYDDPKQALRFGNSDPNNTMLVAASMRRGRPLPNVWLGVTAENQLRVDQRLPVLLQIPAAGRFISVEPMLGQIKLPQVCDHGACMDWGNHPCDNDTCPSRKLDWVICGGESGPGARPMTPEWVKDLANQCHFAGVSFFFKGWGDWAPNCLCDTKQPHKTALRPFPGHGVMFRCGKAKSGHLHQGEEWQEIPQGLIGGAA